MINLLSPNDQKQLAASRTNTLLLRYIFLIAVVIAVAIIEVFVVYLLLSQEKTAHEQTVQENQDKAAGYSSVSAEAEKFRSDLATSKAILAKQVPYTGLLIAIGKAMPQGSTVESLTLDPTTFGTRQSIAVSTRNPETAIGVKSALQKAQFNGKNIFTEVSFVSVASQPDMGNFLATFNIVYSKETLTP